MNETNLLEAFASYKVRPVKRGRSAMTPEGELVVSCWYAGFQKANVEILRYQEDLTGRAGESDKSLRAHLAEAMSNECGIRVIVAVETAGPKAVDQKVSGPRTTYYARKDLVGRVTAFDGERFTIDFRRARMAAQGKVPRGASSARRAG
jgi:hypothetical protein